MPVDAARSFVLHVHRWLAVVVGAGVFVLAATGVFLAAEEGVVELAERRYRVAPPPGRPPAAFEEVVRSAEAAARGAGTDGPRTATSVEYRSDPREPVRVRMGPDLRILVHPVTAEALGSGAVRLRAFFAGVERWHRWLNLPGRFARRGRAVTGAVNAALLALLATGAFLWIPQRVSLRSVLRNLGPRRGLSARRRRLHWHRVAGAWSLVGLLVLSITAVALSYPTVGDRVGPVVGAWGLGDAGRSARPVVPVSGVDDAAGEARWAAILDSARAASPDWRSLAFHPPRRGESHVRVDARRGRPGQPAKLETLALSASSGAVLSRESWDDRSPGSRGASLVRRVHTGEWWGLFGQALAGLFALGAAALAWTGIRSTIATGSLRPKRTSGERGRGARSADGAEPNGP